MSTVILRLPDVKARTGLARATIYQRMLDGVFPRPISLGGTAVGWIEAEVDGWIEQRIQASRNSVSSMSSDDAQRTSASSQ